MGETTPLSVVGYVRVSTERQDTSPETQRAAIESWCRANGHELVTVCEDIGVSGATNVDERLGLMAAFDALPRGGALVALKRDRLARDLLVSAMITRLAERQGACVLCVEGGGNGAGPEAEMMRGILDVFAQYERALIRQRTKVGLAQKRARGERVGGIPLGFRVGNDGVHLVADDGEQAIRTHAQALRDDGSTLDAVAGSLNARGWTTRSGGPWHKVAVHRLLRSA